MIFASFWGSPWVQFSKFKNFLWVCLFLGKNLSNCIHPVWKLHNLYCHILQSLSMQPRPFQSLLPFLCLCHNRFSGGCLQFNHAAKTCSNLNKKTKNSSGYLKKCGCGVSMFFMATKNIYLLLGIVVIVWNLSCIAHEFCNNLSDLNSSVT